MFEIQLNRIRNAIEICMFYYIGKLPDCQGGLLMKRMVNMKRIFVFFLALALVMSCVPAFAVVQAETVPAVNHLLSNCDSTSGWATEKSWGSMSLRSDAAVGTGSVQVTCQNEMYFFLISPVGKLDFTHVTHLDFWFYTSDPKIFSYGDCGFNLSYSDAWFNEGVSVKAGALKALTLQQGWNHITVPFDFSGMSDSYDIANIGRFRFYAVGLPADVTMTVAVDEVRAVNQAGLEQADQIAADAAIRAIDAIGTVNTYSRLAIADARSAYNALTDAQKALVTNASKLVAAESAFATMTAPQGTTYQTLSNCDTMSGWESRNQVNTTEKTEGTGSIQQSITTQMMYYFNKTAGFDFTGATHLEFDLYVTDTDFFKHGDCGINIASVGTGAWWAEEGIRVYAADLKALTLKSGWNHIKVPLTYLSSPAASFDVKKVTNFRFYAVGFTTETTVMIDDFKVVNEVAQEVSVTVPDDMKNNKPEQSTEQTAWVISDCGATNGISVSSCEDLNVVTVNDETYTVFTALSAGTVEVKAPHIKSNPVSISGMNKNDLALRMQFYVSDASAIKTNGQMELTSGKRPDSNELNWKTSQLELKNGWNVVYLDFADGTDSNGTLDLSAINYMRLYMFLAKDAVMAFDSIKIVKRSVVSVKEDFSNQNSLLNFSGTNAQLTLQDQALAIQGNGQAEVTTSSYDLPIVHPDRTPVEFTLFTENPAGVTSAALVLTDAKGRVATAVLDVSRLDGNNPTAYQVVPSEMEQEKGFNPETATTITLQLQLVDTTVMLDNLEVNIRSGQYWRDWVYNYTTTPGDFSIAVIPDIQELTAAYPQKLDTIMQWLVDNKEKENIQFAIDVGDVTWNGHTKNEKEFQTAAAAFKKLQDAGIDYSIAYGNHDYTHGAPRDTAMFNQYFPLSTFSSFGSYGGAMTEGKSDNTYYCFAVQGIQYMIVSLEFDPQAETVAWANQVIADHPNHNVIVSTHNYLGEAYGKYSYAGEYLWPDLVSKHKNIFMVICGHSILSDSNLAGCISYREDVGVNGNTVYQVMANAQDIDAARGGVGMLLMMRFRDGGKTIDFNYFSPVNNNLAYRTQNQFSVTIPEAELVVPVQEPFTSWTENLSPIFHVGLSSATNSDAHWNDYRYIAQPFIPENETLYGVRLPLNLTSGEATLHLEIRSELNGEAIASSDTVIQSQGNGMYWYDAPLTAPLTVEAGKTYYLAYHLTARESGSVCVVYGTDLGTNKATYPGAVWKMSDGAPVTFSTLSNQLHFGFELMSEDQYAAKAVEDQINALNVQSLDDASAVAAARRAYDGLTDAQKDLVTNLQKLTDAEAKIDELKAQADQEAIDKAAAKVVQDQIDELNVQSLDDKPAVVAARAAYDGLTDAQKDLVTNLQKLTDAEVKIEQLENPAPAITYGDVDGNGKVEAVDALEVLKSVVGKVNLTDDQFKAADTDGNGKADAADALNILKKVVGKIDKFLVEQ